VSKAASAGSSALPSPPEAGAQVATQEASKYRDQYNQNGGL